MSLFRFIRGSTVRMARVAMDLCAGPAAGRRVARLARAEACRYGRQSTGERATEVTALTKRASELEGMRNAIVGIEKRLKELDVPTVTDPAGPQQPRQPVVEGKLREMPVEVTQGMLNQNLLTLTEHVKRQRIQPGEELLIEAAPSGDRFRTDLVVNGNKLRERGAIARFYREAGVSAGDFVELVETAPHQWVLRKAEGGKYQSRRALLSW